MPLILLTVLTLSSNKWHYSFSCSAKNPLLWMSLQGAIKSTVSAAAVCHPVERQDCRNMTVCSHPPCSPDLPPRNVQHFPMVKMTMKDKCSEWILDIKAATTAQLKIITKRTSRRCGVVEGSRIYWGALIETLSFAGMNILKVSLYTVLSVS